MAKKIVLSDSVKNEIRKNYDIFKPSNKEEKSYFNKVKAGKARAANSIKDNAGRYITATLKNEITKALAAQKGVATRNEKNKERDIKEVIKEAGISDKELKRFYEFNREEFQQMIDTGSKRGTNRNYNQLESDIENYKGKIYVNDGTKEKKVSAAEAIHLLTNFNQYLKTRFTAADFSIQPTLTFDGRMILNIPSPAAMTKAIKERTGLDSIKDIEEMDSEETAEILEDYLNDQFDETITVYLSK